jgi:hypothetical protein
VDKWDSTTAEDVEKLWKAVTGALDKGKAVMATGFGDMRYSTVLVGYDTGAKKVYLAPSPQVWWPNGEPPMPIVEYDVAFFLGNHKGTKGFTCSSQHACDVGFFWLGEKTRKTPSELELLVSALARFIPEMTEDRPVWGMPNGLAGLQRWAGTIALDGPEGQWRGELPQWPAQDAGWYFESTEMYLETTRSLAANYLDNVAKRLLRGEAHQALRRAAECYRASAARARELESVARPQPTDDVNEERRLRGQLLQTDPETRQTASRLIWSIFEQEKTAVGHLQRFLTLVGEPLQEKAPSPSSRR